MAIQSSHVMVSSEPTPSRRLRSMQSLPPPPPHILGGKRKTMSSSPTPHILGGKRIRLSPPRKRKEVSPTKELERKRRKISPELPEELIRAEIVTRLPIKSVIRFKHVCKSWRSLFSSPEFVEQHNTYQNPNDKDFLVADKTDSIVIFSRYQQIFALRTHQFDHLIGCAKGLVCTRRGNTVTLWNPAIHQSKEFHLPQLGYNCLIRAGLGFDPVTNDYKVAICYRDGLSHRYAVYSSNSDSWFQDQLFDDVDYKILTRKFKQSARTPDTMVKDCPYWIKKSIIPSDMEKYKVILSLAALKFDATSNKFKFLPEFCSDFSYQKSFKVVNMRDLLTLMAYDDCITGKLDIYSLDEEKGCDGVWCMMYRFGPFKEYWRFQYMQQGFNYGDDFLFYEDGSIHSYDYKTEKFECIPLTKPKISFNTCFTYTPSLVFLQGMTPTNYPQNQSSPFGHDTSTRSFAIS